MELAKYILHIFRTRMYEIVCMGLPQMEHLSFDICQSLSNVLMTVFPRDTSSVYPHDKFSANGTVEIVIKIQKYK